MQNIDRLFCKKSNTPQGVADRVGVNQRRDVYPAEHQQGWITDLRCRRSGLRLLAGLHACADGRQPICASAQSPHVREYARQGNHRRQLTRHNQNPRYLSRSVKILLQQHIFTVGGAKSKLCQSPCGFHTTLFYPTTNIPRIFIIIQTQRPRLQSERPTREPPYYSLPQFLAIVASTSSFTGSLG